MEAERRQAPPPRAPERERDPGLPAVAEHRARDRSTAARRGARRDGSPIDPGAVVPDHRAARRDPGGTADRATDPRDLPPIRDPPRPNTRRPRADAGRAHRGPVDRRGGHRGGLTTVVRWRAPMTAGEGLPAIVPPWMPGLTRPPVYPSTSPKPGRSRRSGSAGASTARSGPSRSSW